MSVTLLLLAAGMSRRFGRLKQLEPLGPEGEAVMDYTLYDGLEAGCTRVVVVVRPEIRDLIAAHVEYRLGDALEWALVEQRLDDLPGQIAGPTNGRPRPWGTGQAVWAAREHIAGPVVVANADDFYGREALRRAVELAEGFGSRPESAQGPGARPWDGALVTYRLDQTLARSGGVSRGICSTGTDGALESIEEYMDLRLQRHDPAEDQPAEPTIIGRSAEGHPRTFSGNEPVSLNLWGFGPGIFEGLTDRFEHFLEGDPSPESEFFLPTAVQELMADGRLAVSTAPAPDRWLGVTHPEDAGVVRDGLLALHGTGHYPPGLAEPLRARSSR